jgi:catechol 2,3-dioxygenase-like lactoylglutathione lyase family enzyme
MIHGINLIVIRARDPDALRRFYEALGLRFVEEQHGSGPRHFAATLSRGGVLEIYPARPSDEQRGGLTFGFVVDDAHALAAVAQGVGGRLQRLGDGDATLRDPEDNLLILQSARSVAAAQ